MQKGWPQYFAAGRKIKTRALECGNQKSWKRSAAELDDPSWNPICPCFPDFHINSCFGPFPEFLRSGFNPLRLVPIGFFAANPIQNLSCDPIDRVVFCPPPGLIPLVR